MAFDLVDPHLHSPLAGSKSLHARTNARVDERPLGDVVRVTHRVYEGEHRVDSLQIGSEGIDVSIVALRPSNALPALILRRVLDNGRLDLRRRSRNGCTDLSREQQELVLLSGD